MAVSDYKQEQARLEKQFLETPREFSIDKLVEHIQNKENITEKLKDTNFFKTIASLALYAFYSEILREYNKGYLSRKHPSLGGMIKSIISDEGVFINVDKRDDMTFKYFGIKNERIYVVSLNSDSKKAKVWGIPIVDEKDRFNKPKAHVEEGKFALRVKPLGSSEEKLILYDLP